MASYVSALQGRSLGETLHVEKRRRGISLKKDQVSGRSTASLGGYQVDVTLPETGDWLPVGEARVRSLRKN